MVASFGIFNTLPPLILMNMRLFAILALFQHVTSPQRQLFFSSRKCLFSPMRHFAKNSIVGRPDYQDSYKQKRKILERDDAVTLFWRIEAF